MPKFSERLDKMVEHISKELESAAGASGGALDLGPSARATLEAMPDLVFRVRPNGAVSMVGRGSRQGTSDRESSVGRKPPDAAAKPQAQPAKKAEPWDPVKGLVEELARQGKDLVTKAVTTRTVQSLDIQVRHGARVVHYEVRAALCDENEVLAAARDVTERREAENALRKLKDDLDVKVQQQSDELKEIKEAFKSQMNLLAEEEDLLRKSFNKAEKLLEETIGVITIIVQKKDPYTAGHQRRTSQLACAIAEEMGLPREQIRVIRIASLLHDLGKVFIPTEFLAKPGKLSEVEFSMIKAHPDTDYQILRTIDFSCPIADIVHQHHERIDGSGYPLGLKGDAIYLEAKIIAVADVVEAMVSDRPHRPAPGIEAALKEISDGRGTLYDPDAVDACVRLFREHDFTFEVPS